MNDPTSWIYDADGKHDVKEHERERVSHGVSKYDIWNFVDYLIWVNIRGLETFKDGHGYPANLAGMEEWNEILDKMIAGFNACATILSDYSIYQDKDQMESLQKMKEEGFALYSEYFLHLWD